MLPPARSLRTNRTRKPLTSHEASKWVRTLGKESSPAPQVEERRATSRYNLALPVEISLALIPTAATSIFIQTRDISTRGFYFNIAQKVTVGAKFEFSIALPIEIMGATQAYVSGTARAVRVEETGESHSGWSGVGAIIESYQVSRGKSVKP